jgi:hypothetical protein
VSAETKSRRPAFATSDGESKADRPDEGDSVERLFPFVLRAGILMIGRETLGRNKSKLHFVLITEDISEAVRTEILEDFKHYPVVQHYGAAELERFFGVKGAKTVGFKKSGLAQSIYAGLKTHRINRPVTPAPRPAAPATPSASPG